VAFRWGSTLRFTTGLRTRPPCRGSDCATGGSGLSLSTHLRGDPRGEELRGLTPGRAGARPPQERPERRGETPPRSSPTSLAALAQGAHLRALNRRRGRRRRTEGLRSNPCGRGSRTQCARSESRRPHARRPGHAMCRRTRSATPCPRRLRERRSRTPPCRHESRGCDQHGCAAREYERASPSSRASDRCDSRAHWRAHPGLAPRDRSMYEQASASGRGGRWHAL
jgi:hypothetical protein